MQNSVDTVNLTIEKIISQNELLSNRLEVLEKRQTILQDSLATMSKLIEKAGIKTEFFGDQLNFQLFWFSALLVLIGWISWKGLIIPFKKSLNDIQNNYLPEMRDDISSEIQEAVKYRDQELKEIKNRGYRALDWVYQSIRNTSLDKKDFKSAFVFTCRILDLIILAERTQKMSNRVLREMDKLLLYANVHSIRIYDFNTKLTELILDVIHKYKGLNDQDSIRNKAFELEKLVKSNDGKPETSFDADNSE